MKNLAVTVEKRVAKVCYGSQQLTMDLGSKPLLQGIARVVHTPSRIQGIAMHMEDVTFSGTRQVIATVNTLAWVLGIKVNGKEQLQAVYSGKPNITKPRA